jgi:hypothetical protein
VRSGQTERGVIPRQRREGFNAKPDRRTFTMSTASADIISSPSPSPHNLQQPKYHKSLCFVCCNRFSSKLFQITFVVVKFDFPCFSSRSRLSIQCLFQTTRDRAHDFLLFIYLLPTFFRTVSSTTILQPPYFSTQTIHPRHLLRLLPPLHNFQSVCIKASRLGIGKWLSPSFLFIPNFFNASMLDASGITTRLYLWTRLLRARILS